MMFITAECDQSVITKNKIDELQLLVLAPLGSHLGGVLGAQMEAKAIKKHFKQTYTNDAQIEAKLVPNGIPKWSQNCQT